MAIEPTTRPPTKLASAVAPGAAPSAATQSVVVHSGNPPQAIHHDEVTATHTHNAYARPLPSSPPSSSSGAF
jgi:hypothetical protein